MLSREDNEIVTRVGPATPMGRTIRMYWGPAVLSAEIAEPDGAPVRVRLLGEDLVAFRDIPRSPENPKILGVDDSEIVGDLVAIVAPFSGQLDAQEVQDGLAEVLERRVAPVMGDVPVHQPP